MLFNLCLKYKMLINALVNLGSETRSHQLPRIGRFYQVVSTFGHILTI